RPRPHVRRTRIAPTAEARGHGRTTPRASVVAQRSCRARDALIVLRGLHCLLEPRTAERPGGVHGARGDLEALGGLFGREAEEVPVDDDLRRPWVLVRELGQEVVEDDEIDVRGRRRNLLIERRPPETASMDLRLPSACTVDEDLSHRAGGGPEEVPS